MQGIKAIGQGQVGLFSLYKDDVRDTFEQIVHPSATVIATLT